ncbi:hypothetical protein OIU84_027034 [Salix udensis]|uniref:Selenoprotein F n=1 Tax=Salix udensis TaxID=889485 RepID=A0AAD6KGN3_9ROSI|nr:hypothetical protein OIU84_027034 [Salix udensis]
MTRSFYRNMLYGCYVQQKALCYLIVCSVSSTEMLTLPSALGIPDDKKLVSECLKCCTEDSDDSISKITYSGAIIEVCMRKLVFYPEIVSFIEEEKGQFPTVKVQYLFNSPPKLIMLDDEGQHKETIRIDNWKREHVLQFLKEKVKPTSAI